MYTETYQNKNLHNDFREYSKSQNECEVCEASAEIILDSFYNGKEIDFPF